MGAKTNIVCMDGSSPDHLVGEPVEDVVKLLESALDRAQSGMSIAVSIVEVDREGWVHTSIHAAHHRFTLLGGLSYAGSELNKSIDDA